MGDGGWAGMLRGTEPDLRGVAERRRKGVGAAVEGVGAGPRSGRRDRKDRKKLAMRVGALLLVVIALTVVGYRLGWFDAKRITSLLAGMRAQRNPWVAASIFFLVYVAAVAVGLPALPFTIAGGAIFGFVLGTALSWSAAIAGSIGGYFLARSIGRETARRWFARRSIGTALTADASFWTLLRLRLIPVVPLSVVNFASGLARAHLGTYVLATAIGILPATTVYGYFADSLVSGLAGAKGHALRDVLLSSAALVVLSLVPLAVRRAGSRESGSGSPDAAR